MIATQGYPVLVDCRSLRLRFLREAEENVGLANRSHKRGHPGYSLSLSSSGVVLGLKARLHQIFRGQRVARGYQALSCGRKAIDDDSMSVPE